MRILMLALAMTVLSLAARAQTVDYHVSFENAAHHEARIHVTLAELSAGPVTFRMSRSSPGRYALHEFGKNVYKVSATDSTGNALPVEKPDPYRWVVSGHDGTIRLSYTLFADRADGTYSGIDRTHAHLNMPATFMWAVGFGNRPIAVTFKPVSPDWRAATQLVPTDDPMRFTAPDLYYFLDSPVELSAFDLREWQVGEGNAARTIRLAVHHEGSEADMDRFAGMAQRVVAAQIDLFGEAPDFDYGTYTFIACYMPHVSGDGMEHRNSTILTRAQSLQDGNFRHIGTVSHEFIHAWNVERLRPADLEPFDFTRANMSSHLWFGEGFTSYLGPLTELRAGTMDFDQFIGTMGRFIDMIANRPGRQFRSPVDMSRMAPFVDAATAVDPTNYLNNFLSYYVYGAGIGLALDLTLRADYGLSLDDYMAYLWTTHGAPEIPYTNADLEAALGALTGDADFAHDFFARFIYGSELPDYETLLAQAGIILHLRAEGEASPGRARLDFSGDHPVLRDSTWAGSPFYEAGLDAGAEILSLGGQAVTDEASWNTAIAQYGIGDAAEIHYRQRGLEHASTITFRQDTRLGLTSADTLTEAQRTFRRSWLGIE